MRKSLIALALALVTVPAFAQEGKSTPPDVPRDHWAFKAVDELFRAGILVGYPDGLFRGGRPASRYELASGLHSLNFRGRDRLDRLQADLQLNAQGSRASGDTLAEFRRAMDDLRREIEGLKAQRVEFNEVRDRMKSLRQELDRIRGDVDEMRRMIGSTRTRVRG